MAHKQNSGEDFAGSTTGNDGLLVEGKPVRSSSPIVEAHTANDTLTAVESGSLHSNDGATGTITLILPAAVAGLNYSGYVLAAQELRFDPDGTETIALPSTGAQGATGKYLTANAVGEHVELFCVKAGQWEALAFGGTWTAEA